MRRRRTEERHYQDTHGFEYEAEGYVSGTTEHRVIGEPVDESESAWMVESGENISPDDAAGQGGWLLE